MSLSVPLVCPLCYGNEWNPLKKNVAECIKCKSIYQVEALHEWFTKRLADECKIKKQELEKNNTAV